MSDAEVFGTAGADPAIMAQPPVQPVESQPLPPIAGINSFGQPLTPQPHEMSDADVFGSAPNGQPAATSAHPDFLLGLYQGAVKPFDNAARGLEWLAGKAGLPVDQIDTGLGMPSAQQATDAHRNYIATQALLGKRPGPVGNFLGEVGGTIPFTLGMGPLASGATTGALLSDAKTPQQLAFDTGFGAVGGKVADMGLQQVSKMLAPSVAPAVQKLLDAGVGLTPGQILGGAYKRVEDAATSIPIFGDIIKNAQARGMSDFRRAAINQTLEPIGQKLPDGMGTGYEAVDYAHKALGEAYEGLLPSLTVKTDPAFNNQVTALRTLALNLTPDYAKKFENLVQSEVLGRFAPQTGVMTGETMKEVEATLGQQATRFGKVQDGHAQDYADAVRQLQAELRGLVERSNPAVADQLGAINSGWAKLVRVENAAGRQGATGGEFTPSHLAAAVRAGDNSVRKNASARGGALMQDFAQAGKEVLPSSVPDSGSPFRHALEATVALLVGQEAHALPLMLKGAAVGGTLGAAYTRGGQRVVTPLLTQRPAAAQAAAKLLPYLKTPALPAGGAAAVTAAQNWPQ